MCFVSVHIPACPSPAPYLQYADPVTDLLDQCGVFRTRLFRESCVFHQGCYVKDLSRLGRDLHKTLILDNSPASYIFHPNNAVSFDLLLSTLMFLLVPKMELTIVTNNIHHSKDVAPPCRRPSSSETNSGTRVGLIVN